MTAVVNRSNAVRANMLAPSAAREDVRPDPNRIAFELTGRDYISHSAIRTYQQCPLRYFFSYVAGLAPEFVSSSLVFGGAIHSAIELHYRRMIEGTAPPSIDEFLAAYEQAWQQDAKAPVRFGKSESAASLRDLAQRMLTAFQASDVCQPDTKLLAIEETFRAPVIAGCPDLLGRIDLIVLDGDCLRIIDFKTSRSRWNDANVREASPQMLLYVELAQPLAGAFGVRELRLEWVVITKTKQPVVATHCLTPDAQSIARTKMVVQRVWDCIQVGCFYPSPSAMRCSSCPYASACREWEG